ncbi:MAG: 30S ribosomal protein S18 [Parcubacteria group bacterium]|nr:30S ribosomal protein S18 [Parcubacteria group bacterium]
MEQKQCYFCTNNTQTVDYKNAEMLKRFLDTHSRIVPRRHNGACSLHQRKLARAIKRARIMAIVPFITS